MQKSGGPVVREWQQKLLPSGSAEESLDWMKQTQSKGFGGNVLFKNELNQDIPLEKKIEDLYTDELGDLYTDDIPLLPSMSTLSFDATVKLKLYQVGELIHFYQNTSGHEKGR
ncbi:hypothetical protein KY289_007898 [Solanum tuberosum]|nr:hypothetical protein KY289_007898 [Solanum tuberosum]